MRVAFLLALAAAAGSGAARAAGPATAQAASPDDENGAEFCVDAERFKALIWNTGRVDCFRKQGERRCSLPECRQRLQWVDMDGDGTFDEVYTLKTRVTDKSGKALERWEAFVALSSQKGQLYRIPATFKSEKPEELVSVGSARAFGFETDGWGAQLSDGAGKTEFYLYNRGARSFTLLRPIATEAGDDFQFFAGGMIGYALGVSDSLSANVRVAFGFDGGVRVLSFLSAGAFFQYSSQNETVAVSNSASIIAPLRMELYGGRISYSLPRSLHVLHVSGLAGIAELDVQSAAAPFSTHPFMFGGGIGWDFYSRNHLSVSLDTELLDITASTSTASTTTTQGTSTVTDSLTSQAGALLVFQGWVALRVWF